MTDLRRASNELERQVQRVRQAEVEATDERDRLNLILENVADPILVTDRAANIILMNDEAEQLFHGPKGESRSYRVSQSVRQNDTMFTSFISEFALTDERLKRERMVLVHPMNGAPLAVEVVSGKIRNDRGEPIAIVSVLHDLTQQVENERLYDALKQLNSELEDRIVAATSDLAQLERAAAWQSEELAGANKLGPTSPACRMITYAAQRRHRLFGAPPDGIAGERQRAAGLHHAQPRCGAPPSLTTTFDLSRIEGQDARPRQRVLLEDLINEVAEQVELMMTSKRLACRSPRSVRRSRRTRRNSSRSCSILSNVKFTNRLIRLQVDREADSVVPASPTRARHPPDEIDAIWEDFRQLDQSRTRSYGGTGWAQHRPPLTQQLGGHGVDEHARRRTTSSSDAAGHSRGRGAVG